MEVAGKRFEAEPQIVKQGFYGDVAYTHCKSKDPTDGNVVIEDRKIPWKV